MNNKLGFTLVELAVALIIIGLALTGVTKGAELIKSAQLSRYAIELQTYATSYQNFVSIYWCIPGDCANAEAFFGVDNTNNGNGNGIVEYGNATERYLAWNHLGLSGFAPGEFTFAAAVGGGVYQTGENIPESSISNVGYMILSDPATIYNVAGNTYNAIFTGKRRSDGMYHVAFLTPSEAHNVDVKIDDGLSAKGNLLATDGYNADTASWYSDSCNALVGSEYEFQYDNTTFTPCRQIYFLNKWR